MMISVAGTDHESESAALSTAICKSKVDTTVQPDIVACSLTHVSSDTDTAIFAENDASIDANPTKQLITNADCAEADNMLSVETECHHHIAGHGILALKGKLAAASSSGTVILL